MRWTSLAAGRSTPLLQNPRENPGPGGQEFGARENCSGTDRGGKNAGPDHGGFGVDSYQGSSTPMVYIRRILDYFGSTVYLKASS